MVLLQLLHERPSFSKTPVSNRELGKARSTEAHASDALEALRSKGVDVREHLPEGKQVSEALAK